ncbi:MAG: phosphate ABC transporter permease [Spongiibacteraceae bacterium]|jgi:lipopolysaccharide transport system permease protein|nr:phosphate ABC transporter permease [Spongiibacteraceae bacterium]|tara:strand:- start:204 stop:1046 length:843 start_codon:yes stop_codon:yes gene_type:complete
MKTSIRIKAGSNDRLVDLRELYAYRDILVFLVWRDIKVLYAQTVLGFGWAILRPLLSMAIFTLVFGRLVGMPSDGVPYPVFAYTALLPWIYFSSSFVKSSDSLVAMAATWTKVYFPRLILPLVPIVSSLVDFFIAFVVLLAMMFFYGITLTPAIAFLPLLIILMVLTSSGIGMWLSALSVQYRDVRHANQFVSQLLMYMAPVVWPASLIAEKFPVYGDVITRVYAIYPMVGIIEGFRSAMLGVSSMPWDLIAVGGCSSVLMTLTGASYFRRRERIFADVA